MSLSKEHSRHLLELAQASISYGLKTGQAINIELDVYPEELKALRATFVTLHLHAQLRGCIGVLEAIRPLALDIVYNAFSAAFRDPRFPPLSGEEYKDLRISLSLLTPAEPLNFGSEQNLIAQLQPGVDGLILEEGRRRGTFLPSVWENLADPKEFLRHLKQKAGLAPDYWSDSLKLFRYRTEKIE